MSVGTMFRPLRHRDFRLLWGGQAISLIGDGAFSVALTWQTLELSSTPGALAVVTVARSVPRLALLLVGGVVSDRVSRRRLMVVTDSLQAIGVGVIAVLAATDALQVWHLAGLAALVGGAHAFYLPTITAIVPELVPRDELMQANALRSGSQMLAEDFAGPALGGLLVATAGTAVAFGLDAATFALSVVALVAIQARPKRAVAEPDLRRQVTEGFTYVKSRRWLWVSLVAVGFANFFLTGSLALVIPLQIKNELGGSAGALGAYFASIGLGGGLGILLTGGLRARQRRLHASYAAWGLSAAALAAVGFAPTVPLMLACGLVVGAGLQYGNIMWETLLQEAVPHRILGRVTSFDWFVSLALQPLSFALAAPVVAAIGSSRTLVAAGTLDLVVLVVGFMQRGVRDARPEDDADSEKSAPASD